MTRCGTCGGGGNTCTCFTAALCVEFSDPYVVMGDETTITTPDSVSTSITGDIDIRVKVNRNDWTRFSIFGEELGAKYDFGTLNDTVWDFFVDDTSGVLAFNWIDSGSSFHSTLTSFGLDTLGFIPNSIHWIRVTLDVSTAIVDFYTSDENGLIWTLFESVGPVTAPPTDIFDGDGDIEIAAFNTLSSISSTWQGAFFIFELRDGIDGTLVASYDTLDAGAISGTRNPNTFQSVDTGETWLISGEDWIWSGISCVENKGNGTLSHPFQFKSTLTPEIRPFGHIQRTTGILNPGTSYIMPFDLDTTGINGGMANLVGNPTKLIAPIGGVYLVGAFIAFGADPTDLVKVWVVKNDLTGSVLNAGIELNSEIPDSTSTRLYSLITLIEMNPGDYIQLHVEGSATMDVIVLDSGLTTRPTLWAQWMGF